MNSNSDINQKTSFSDSLEKIILNSLYLTSVSLILILTSVFYYFIQENLDELNKLKINYNVELLNSTTHSTIDEISELSKAPKTINTFLTSDTHEVKELLQNKIDTGLAEYIAIYDSKGELIISTAAKGYKNSYKSTFTKKERFSLLSAKQLAISTNKNEIVLAQPIIYYSKAQGFIEVRISPIKYLQPIKEEGVEFQLTTFSNKELFTNVNNSSYFISSSPINSPFVLVNEYLVLSRYETTNPYLGVLLPAILGLIILFAIIIPLFIYSAKKLSQRMVEPINRLVSRVSDKTNPQKCFPLNADIELEFLAKAFDEKTDALMAAQSSLEEKIISRTQAYLEQKEKAEDALRARSVFIANMSHEIRTPLNGILGLTDILFESVDNKENIDKLKSIQESGDLLLSIINDVLDYSKIESKKVVLESTPFDICDSIKKSYEFFKHVAIQKGLKLECKITDKIQSKNQLYMGDPTKINQILFNLIGNAIKFTEKGFVKIELDLGTHHGAEKDLIIFRVKDSGIGISTDKQSTLFDAFTQADGSITRRFGGSGLGLTISKQLSQLMDADLSFESIKNKGTCFTLKIPLKVATEQKVHIKPTKSAEQESLKGMKVLVAEDNNVNQKVILSYLNKLEIETNLANNGKEAIALCEQEHFDLILMDMQMPVLDGIEATIAIKKLEAYKNIPILALTANVFSEDRERCFAAGMDDFIPKPLKKKTLIDALTKYRHPKKPA